MTHLYHATRIERIIGVNLQPAPEEFWGVSFTIAAAGIIRDQFPALHREVTYHAFPKPVTLYLGQALAVYHLYANDTEVQYLDFDVVHRDDA